MMARPPTSKFFSTTMTEAPASRAATAAGIPPAPEPMTTMSASRSHLMAASAEVAVTPAKAAAPLSPAVPLLLKNRRLLTVSPLSRTSIFDSSGSGIFYSAQFILGCCDLQQLRSKLYSIAHIKLNHAALKQQVGTCLPAPQH